MDVNYGKPNPSSGFPIEAFDFSGVGTAFIEGVGLCGWDPVDLVWRRVIVTTAGQLSISGGGGSGGGGVQYQELSYVNHLGTGNVILGEAVNGTLYTPTILPLTSATALVVAIVDNTGNQITSFGGGGGGGGTTTVVQGTAANLNATVVGTVTNVPSGTQTIVGTVVTSGTGIIVGVEGVQVWGAGALGTWTNVGYGTTGTVVNLNMPVSIQAGTAAVTQVTSPWVVTGTMTPSGTQPVSGTITNIQSGTATDAVQLYVQGTTGTWSAVSTGGAAVPVSQVTSPWIVGGTTTSVPSGTQSVAQTGSPWGVSGTVTAVESGTWSVTIAGTETIQYAQVAAVSTAWTSAASLNAVSTVPVSNLCMVTVGYNPTAGVTGGGVFFEASPDNSNWYTIAGQQNGTSFTVNSTFSLGTVATSWDFNAAAFVNFRVRLNPQLTGTGTGSFIIIPSAAPATVPVTAGLAAGTNIIGTATTVPTGTQTVSVAAGTVAVTQVTSPWVVGGTITNVPSGTQTVAPSGVFLADIFPTTTNTIPSIYMNISISTTGTNIKSSAGAIYGYYISNLGTSMSFVKIYNTNTTPTTTNVPVITMGIPGSGAANISFPYGLPFSSGIGIYCSGSATSTDSTAPSGQVVANIYYA